jgi:hypothetical protein
MLLYGEEPVSFLSVASGKTAHICQFRVCRPMHLIVLGTLPKDPVTGRVVEGRISRRIRLSAERWLLRAQWVEALALEAGKAPWAMQKPV